MAVRILKCPITKLVGCRLSIFGGSRTFHRAKVGNTFRKSFGSHAICLGLPESGIAMSTVVFIGMNQRGLLRQSSIVSHAESSPILLKTAPLPFGKVRGCNPFQTTFFL